MGINSRTVMRRGADASDSEDESMVMDGDNSDGEMQRRGPRKRRMRPRMVDDEEDDDDENVELEDEVEELDEDGEEEEDAEVVEEEEEEEATGRAGSGDDEDGDEDDDEDEDRDEDEEVDDVIRVGGRAAVTSHVEKNIDEEDGIPRIVQSSRRSRASLPSSRSHLTERVGRRKPPLPNRIQEAPRSGVSKRSGSLESKRSLRKRRSTFTTTSGESDVDDVDDRRRRSNSDIMSSKRTRKRSGPTSGNRASRGKKRRNLGLARQFKKEKRSVAFSTDNDESDSDFDNADCEQVTVYTDQEFFDPRAQQKVMERILARKIEKREAPTNPVTAAVMEANPIFLYLVKWKGLSYIHCEWVSEDIILAQSQGKGRLQRFIRKEEIAAYQKDGDDDVEEEEPVPEEFVTVDRVIGERDHNGNKMYFVKWRSLQYCESTWEYAEDIKDDQKLEEFKNRRKLPAPETKLLQPHFKPRSVDFSHLPMPIFKNGGQLRPYQMEGYNWLVSCWFRGQGSILADEMGLGKTLQSVSFCNYLYHDRLIRGPFLVIAPLSTLGHWAREFETWTYMNAIVYHGNVDSRRIIQDYEWAYSGQTNPKGPPYKWDILITTYETILQDASKLRSIPWEAIIIDEAHKIKNRSSRLVGELKGFESKHRILLTGTPIQNNSLEVWALLHYIDPEKFASQQDFERDFGEIKDSETVDRLKEVMRPYLLRRLKEDVEKSIPPKEETIVSVELTRIQKKWYRAMLEQNFSFLDTGTKSAKNVGNLRNIVMELRKCCNHPYLIKGVEQIEVAALKSTDEAKIMNHLIEASGKLVLVDKLLPKLKESGHKVLIFSQMIRVLDILEDYLVARRWGYERIDGRVRGNDRQQAIDRYCKKDSDKFVFLLCTRAGGQGINLTVADTVIIYDSDWNPQNDIQAQARCHRIGQQNDVKVYRLITRATYEQDMFDRASKKLGLDHAVLQNMGVEGMEKKNQSLLGEMKKNDIDSLLKKGAYDVFNEDDTAADAFTKEDIDLILERRTTLLQSAAANSGPSAFSKASFASETQKPGESVELDDPDFWRKLMPAAASGPDPSLELRPRVRRQTQRFNPADSSDEEVDDGSEDEGYNGVSPLGKKLWNKGERQRVQRGLMTLGWGRWKDIHKFGDFGQRRSVDEVAYFCRRLVRLAMEVIVSGDPDVSVEDLSNRFPFLETALQKHRRIVACAPSNDSDGHFFSDILRGYEYGEELAEPMFTEPVLHSPDYEDYLGRNASHLIERMDMLTELCNLARQNAFDDGMEVPVVGSSGSQSIGEYWSPDFDRDLLRGTIRHGYGNYRMMRLDPDLVYLGRTEPVVEKDESEEDNGKEFLSNQVTYTENSGIISTNSPQKPPPSKIPVVSESMDVLTVHSKETENGLPQTEADKSHEDQGNGMDIDCTAQSSLPNCIEVNRVETCENDIGGDEKDHSNECQEHSDQNNVTIEELPHQPSKNDEEISPMEISEGTQGKVCEASTKDERKLVVLPPDDSKPVVAFIPMDELWNKRPWPQVQVLNVRVKKLAKAFLRMKRKAEKQARVEEEQEKQRRAREQRKLDKLREEQEKIREKELRQQANLRVWTKKEKSDFAKYLCSVGLPPLDAEGNTGDSSWELLRERIGLSRKTGELVQEYFESFQAMCWDALKLEANENAETRYSTAELEDARISAGSARRWLERVQFLEKLRTKIIPKLEFEYVRDRLKKIAAPVKRDGLPSYWADDVVYFDVHLVRAVATHGLAPSVIALDESLPFRDRTAKFVYEASCRSPDFEQQAELDQTPLPLAVLSSPSEVKDSDIVNFFAKDRALFARVYMLSEKIAAVNSQVKSGGSKKAQTQANGPSTSQPESKQPSPETDKVDVAVLPGELIRWNNTKIWAAKVGSGFEKLNFDIFSRRLLKALKHYKKTVNEPTLAVEVELPDWTDSLSTQDV
mmetsp:Transcript_2659/g.4794  ORF Transcript_2659/g.4794 Transcript_2659/m.4794 type:complete len:1931 (-) Transcript_2659:2818-8610(-)